LAIALANAVLAQSTPRTGDAGDPLWRKLEARVNETVEKFDGEMGVAIVDLTDGRAILKNADRVFPTASSIKIAILLELYHQEEQARDGGQGKARLNDLYDVDPKVLVDFSSIMQGLTPGITKITNHDLAQFMIAVSDNTAANVLIDRLGMENVNATLRSLGLTKTMLRRHMMDFEAAKRGNENVSTPREMTQLLEKVYKGDVLNKELTADFIKQLSTLKESELPHDLPEGVQIANKPGSLKGVRNDCGIVFAKDRPFVICVMTENARDERGAERTITGLALDAYRYFEQRGKEMQWTK
ncbi:MAG TPA: serine hydrolase, partial [Chthoniobacterales bacterium]